jgi:hypothetical protein
MRSQQNKKKSTEVVISESEYDSDASSTVRTDAETEEDYSDDGSSMGPASQPESVNSIPVKIMTHSTSRGRSSSSKRSRIANLADGLGNNKDRFRAGLPLIEDNDDVWEGKDKARKEKDEKKGKKKRTRSSSPTDDKPQTQKKRQMAKVVSIPEGCEVDLSHSTRLPYKSYNLGFNYKMHTSRYCSNYCLSQHN